LCQKKKTPGKYAKIPQETEQKLKKTDPRESESERIHPNSKVSFTVHTNNNASLTPSLLPS
jgi:hypothetical protein